MKKGKYPGAKEAEKEKSRISVVVDEEPDCVYPGVPNYEKFDKLGWSTEKVLVWLNID